MASGASAQEPEQGLLPKAAGALFNEPLRVFGDLLTAWVLIFQSACRGSFLAMVRKSWSFKDDRRLLELAKSKKALEQIAKAMDRSPERIRKRAMRLGVSIKSQAAGR
jgi:hypothetical protein